MDSAHPLSPATVGDRLEFEPLISDASAAMLRVTGGDVMPARCLEGGTRDGFEVGAGRR